jgi:hypothetical protein
VTDDVFYGDVVDGIVRAPEGIDVAMVWVRSQFQSKLLARCIDLDRVESRADRRIDRDVLLAVAGFPKQFTFDRRVDVNIVEARFVDSIRYTYDHRHDHEHISIGWRSAKISGESFPHAEFGTDPTTMTPLRKPAGISGGPVYTVAATRPNSLWAPSQDARLVGVASKWNTQREHAVPYWRWNEWLRDALSS